MDDAKYSHGELSIAGSANCMMDVVNFPTGLPVHIMTE